MEVDRCTRRRERHQHFVPDFGQRIKRPDHGAVAAEFQDRIAVAVRVMDELRRHRRGRRGRVSRLADAPAQHVIGVARHRDERGTSRAFHAYEPIRVVVAVHRAAAGAVAEYQVAVAVVLLGSEGRQRVLVQLKIRRLRQRVVHLIERHRAVLDHLPAVAVGVQRIGA